MNPEPPPTYRRALGLACVDGTAETGDADRCYVAVLPVGRPFVFSDTARLIWQALPGTPAEVAQSVGKSLTDPPGDLLDVVSEFLIELSGLQLVVVEQ